MYVNLKELYENDPKNYDKNCEDICKKLFNEGRSFTKKEQNIFKKIKDKIFKTI